MTHTNIPVSAPGHWVEDGRDELRTQVGDLHHARLFATENPVYPHYQSRNYIRVETYNNAASGGQAGTVRQLVQKTLGGDTSCPDVAALPDGTLLDLYYSHDGRNADLVAALSLKAADGSRKLLDVEPGKRLKIIWGPTLDVTQAKLNEMARLTPATLAFIANPANREAMRTRFPAAGLSDEYIDRVVAEQPQPAQ